MNQHIHLRLQEKQGPRAIQVGAVASLGCGCIHENLVLHNYKLEARLNATKSYWQYIRMDTFRQTTILCVDDEPAITNALKRHLRSCGEIITTNSAREALDLFEQNEVDLIIIDMRMPDMSGIELLRAIEETKSERAFGRILLTGNSELEDHQDVFALVPQENIVRKPWIKQELVTAVDRVLKSNRTGE